MPVGPMRVAAPVVRVDAVETVLEVCCVDISRVVAESAGRGGATGRGCGRAVVQPTGAHEAGAPVAGLME